MRYIIVALIAGVMLSACTPGPLGNQNQNTNDAQENQNTNTNSQGGNGDTGGTDSATTTPQGWLQFENRATGYSVNYPANWYWRHYISTEIDNPEINDYFVANPTGPIVLQSEFLGRYVIEASAFDRNQLISNISLGDKTERNATVAGESATRIQGTQDGEILSGYTMIYYIFTHGGKTYRVSFAQANPSQADIDQFEVFVSGLTF